METETASRKPIQFRRRLEHTLTHPLCTIIKTRASARPNDRAELSTVVGEVWGEAKGRGSYSK